MGNAASTLCIAGSLAAAVASLNAMKASRAIQADVMSLKETVANVDCRLLEDVKIVIALLKGANGGAVAHVDEPVLRQLQGVIDAAIKDAVHREGLQGAIDAAIRDAVHKELLGRATHTNDELAEIVRNAINDIVVDAVRKQQEAAEERIRAVIMDAVNKQQNSGSKHIEAVVEKYANFLHEDHVRMYQTMNNN